MDEQGRNLRVFISYARRDASAFAEELLSGLELAGFDPFLDRHDIAVGEDWEQRLGGLIQAADTVVFVITPAAVSSERCTWEVVKAQALSKRIIPVVAIEVSEAETPEALKRLNYVFFTEGRSFTKSLGDLAKALRTDLDWIREHTRLGELALRWRERGKAEPMLLRGSELQAAKAWVTRWSPGAPEPTDLHRAFISDSDAAEESRRGAERAQLEEMAAAQATKEEALRRLSRRTTLGLVAAGGLAAGAAGLAYWGVDAEQRFTRERRQRETAEQNSRDAVILREANRTDLFGLLTAYAASPGELAADGEQGENSPYTKAVLAALAEQDTSLQAALARSHLQVAEASPTHQQPYIESNLNADLYLKRRSPTRRLKAIVIAASEVGGMPMPNTVRDAAAWAEFLGACGFECVTLENPSDDEVRAAFEQVNFAMIDMRPDRGGVVVPTGIVIAPSQRAEPAREQEQRPAQMQAPVIEDQDRLHAQPPAARSDFNAPPDTLLFVFYAGAGVYLDGENYIGLANTRVDRAGPLKQTAVSVSSIETLARSRAAASVIVLDTNFTVLSTEPPAGTR